MKHLQSIALDRLSREELLPGFAPDFPYISTCAQLDRYPGSVVPWHWHSAVELFYIAEGTVHYTTSGGKWVFPAGSGGFINSNVLHTTQAVPADGSTVQLLHLFDPSFLSGDSTSRLETKYILPLTAAAGAEVLPLYPADPLQAGILQDIRLTFQLDEQAWGYEFRLREALTQIWLRLLSQLSPAAAQDGSRDYDDKVKRMMIYVHEHYREPLCVMQLAQAAHISKRTCFRLFEERLHMTPVEYIRSYRLQQACRMLTRSSEPITRIGCSCGLGSSSYFGKVFRESFGCSPKEYRRNWHDRDKSSHE